MRWNGGKWIGEPFERLAFDPQLASVHDVEVAAVDGDGDLDIVSKLWRPRKVNANQGRNHVDLLENLMKQ